MTTKKSCVVSVTFWMLRVITWDGILPASVWFAPVVAGLLLPNNRLAIELIAIVLPISSFCIRYRVGRQYITTNNCRSTTRRIQAAALYLGIFVVFFFDAVMILSHVMPKGVHFDHSDIIAFAVLGIVYLAASQRGDGDARDPHRQSGLSSGPGHRHGLADRAEEGQEGQS